MLSTLLLKKIVSGGQTGADRAALDAAIAAGVPHGGWLPKGRKTEDGPLPESYNLQELRTSDYRQRTLQNVLDSQGTLIISHGNLTGGSLLTQQLARRHGRPCLHIDCNHVTPLEAVALGGDWLRENGVRRLNVAGPRMSGDPAIYDTVKLIVTELLKLELFHYWTTRC